MFCDCVVIAMRIPVFSSFQGKIEGGLDNAMVTRQMFYRVRYINTVFHSCISFHTSHVTCGFVLGSFNNSTFCHGLRVRCHFHARCNPRQCSLSAVRIHFNIVCISD